MGGTRLAQQTLRHVPTSRTIGGTPRIRSGYTCGSSQEAADNAQHSTTKCTVFFISIYITYITNNEDCWFIGN
jgi:hypothetical protein